MSFIQSNSQDEKVVVSPKYFWGLRNVRPIALNPTKQELIDLGINTDKEPGYLKLVENVITEFQLNKKKNFQRKTNEKGLSNIFSGLGINNEASILELIDNSIDAKARNINIKISF